MYRILEPSLVVIVAMAALLGGLLFWPEGEPRPAAVQAAAVLSVEGRATGSYPGGEAVYRIELLNHTGRIVYDGVLTITLPLSITYIPGSTVALGEGWPLEAREPVANGQTLTWGPYHLPPAGNKAHNPFGIHTLLHDCTGLPLHLEGARTLVGNGGYVTQLFQGIDATTTGPDECAVKFVTEAYARNLIPILRLEGHFANGVWQAPDPGPAGDYAPVAQGFANFVAGLPRRDTNPLYVQIWNEPDLWIEWSGSPNAVEYARFFVAVSNAIRGLGDGRIRILNAALTPGNPGFIERMLSVSGFRDGFDAWASHCYPYNHPAWYNNHLGTARYGTYAIDCYLEELSILRRYGRGDVKVILTETGYELGSNIFGFEGFPSINETNRAEYIASAFGDFWQNWPEVIAVTPFELADPAGHWYTYDWIYPTPPYPPHPQYTAVSNLPKPDGGLEPYGYQIIFKARVSPDLPPGEYPAQLSGSERDGARVTASSAATLTVRVEAPPYTTYLPLIFGPVRRDGPWYLGASTPRPASPGAIVPTDFLTPAGAILASLHEVTNIPLTDEPLEIALIPAANRAAALLDDGRLDIVDLPARRVSRTMFVGDRPQRLAPAADPDRVYVSLDGALALVDLPTARVVARRSEPGRWRGLAHDPATRRLFAADAAHDRLVVWRDDLSVMLAQVPLGDTPDNLILAPKDNRVYVIQPAARRVTALNLDSLTITTRSTPLPGGPILDVAHLATRNQLHLLTAFTPRLRGLAVLETPSLRRANLIAAAGDLRWQTATALAVTPSGQLLTLEAGRLWQIDPATRAVAILPVEVDPTAPHRLAVHPDGGTVYWFGNGE